jgi:hypothetical protein
VKWTEAAVIERLREAYLLPEGSQAMDEWAMLTHVPLRMPDGRNERIIDALAVRCWGGGKGHVRLAFEVKVSRPDYRNETPEKRAPAEASAHQCAYVVPAGLIRPDELPDGWGLIEVFENGSDRPPTSRPLGSRALWRKYAAKREPVCDLDYLVSAGFRRASRAEEAIRHGVLPEAEVARMRRENDSLHGIVSRAKDAQRRAEQRVKDMRNEILALAGDQECADCSSKVTWRLGAVSGWSHVDKTQDGPCRKIRAEADRLRKEAETGSKYSWGFAPPVEPKAIREMRLADQKEMGEAS